MSLPELDIDQLISLVQMRPVLWNKMEEKYKDKHKTQEAWNEICNEIIENFDQLEEQEKQKFGKHVLKKWTQVRDSYRKSLLKTKAAMKSGAGAANLKTYIYGSQLRFLDKIFETRNADDSLSESVDDFVIDDNEVVNEEYQVNPDKEPGPSGSGRVGGAKKSQENKREIKKPSTKKQKLDKTDLERIAALRGEQNRHISFFYGILPSIDDFDELQTLTFQMEVLKIVTSIRQWKQHVLPCDVDTGNELNNGQLLQQYRQRPTLTSSLPTSPLSKYHKMEPAVSATYSEESSVYSASMSDSGSHEEPDF